MCSLGTQYGKSETEIRALVIAIRYRQDVSIRKIYSTVNLLGVNIFRLVRSIKMKYSSVTMQKILFFIQEKTKYIFYFDIIKSKYWNFKSSV